MSSIRPFSRRRQTPYRPGGDIPLIARAKGSAFGNQVRPARKPRLRSGGNQAPYRRREFAKSQLRLLSFLLISALVTLAVLYYLPTTDERQARRDAAGPAAPPLMVPPLPSPLTPVLPQSTRGDLRHRVRRGDTLASIVQRYGIASETTRALQESLNSASKQHGSAVVLKAGQRLNFTFDPSGELSTMVLPIEPGRRFEFSRIEPGPDGAAKFAGAVQVEPVKRVERIAVGLIETSFAAAAAAAGIKYDLVDEFVDLFSGRVSFHRDLQRGNRFTLIYHDEVIKDGTSTGSGAILAAALEAGTNQYVAVRYVGADGKPRYFNQKGELLGDSFLRYPLKFSRISSHFTTSRFHPVLKRRRPHNGVDFAAPTGTPVRSVANGKVIVAGRSGGNGIMVKIQHDARYSTAYLHLSKLAKGIRKGAVVKRGQVIGAVGMTGLATGPHLHYSFYDRGRYVDPLKIKLPMLEQLNSRTRIEPGFLKRVLFSLRHYQSVDLQQFYSGQV